MTIFGREQHVAVDVEHRRLTYRRGPDRVGLDGGPVYRGTGAYADWRLAFVKPLATTVRTRAHSSLDRQSAFSAQPGQHQAVGTSANASQPVSSRPAWASRERPDRGRDRASSQDGP